jgi:hypothetical protein
MSSRKDKIWEEFKVLPASEEHKTARVECLHCGKCFAHQGSSRLKSHIFGGSGVAKCLSVAASVVDKHRAVVASSVQSSQPSIRNVFGTSSTTAADEAVADFIFQEGIAFHKTETGAFKRMLGAVSKCPGYLPPKRTRLSTTLLNDAYSRSQVKVQPLLDAATASRGNSAGYSLCSDGANDVTSRPLVNVVFMSASGNVFLRAHDTSGKPKTSKFLAKLITRHIEDIGPDNCVLVVTDNAANCKGAGARIEIKFPHITWVGCLAHCSDLMLKDIGGLSWVQPLLSAIRAGFKFIRSHSQPLALYRKHSSKELLMPGETRFGSLFLMLQRYLDVQQSLKALFADPDWAAWVEAQGSKKQAKAEKARRDLGRKSNAKLAKAIVAATEPIVKLLRMADSQVPCTGKVYHTVWSLKELLLTSGLSTVDMLEVCIHPSSRMIPKGTRRAAVRYAPYQPCTLCAGHHATHALVVLLFCVLTGLWRQ